MSDETPRAKGVDMEDESPNTETSAAGDTTETTTDTGQQAAATTPPQDQPIPQATGARPAADRPAADQTTTDQAAADQAAADQAAADQAAADRATTDRAAEPPTEDEPVKERPEAAKGVRRLISRARKGRPAEADERKGQPAAAHQMPAAETIERPVGERPADGPPTGQASTAPEAGDDKVSATGDATSDPSAAANADDKVPLPVLAARSDDDLTPDPLHDVEQRKREAGVDSRFPFGRPGRPVGQAHPFIFGFTAALGVITAWLLVQAANSAKSVIVMIVVAMFLAVGLNPAVERLKRIGLNRSWAVGVVFLCVMLFFAGFVASLVPPLSEQITDLTKNVPHYISQLQSNPKIAEWDRRYRLLEQAQNKINDPSFQQDLAKRAYDVGRQALSGTFQTLTILILTLYFLSSLPQIKTFFYQLAPRSRRARVALLGDEILERIGGYVAGQFTIAFIAGVTSYIFLQILGLKYALALALIVAVTDLIPLIGATIGAVVVSLVAFLTGIPEGIACVIFYLVYQQVENYVFYPRVMKRTVNVQPAVTIVAALVGAALLGVVGALLAIPTAAAISLLVREVVVPRQDNL